MAGQEEERNLPFPLFLGWYLPIQLCSFFLEDLRSNFCQVTLDPELHEYQLFSLSLEMVAPCFLLLLIGAGGWPPRLVWLLSHSTTGSSCYCFYVTNYPQIQWLETTVLRVRSLGRHSQQGFSLVHPVWASAGKTDAEGDVTPDVAGGGGWGRWNRLKVIDAHVCCPGF